MLLVQLGMEVQKPRSGKMAGSRTGRRSSITNISTVVEDAVNWRKYSTMQKLLTLAFGFLFVSWITSLWTLMFTFAVTVGGGIYLTNQFLLHEKTSVQAEQFFDFVESTYIDAKQKFSHIKATLLNSNGKPDSNVVASSELIYDFSSFAETDSDKVPSEAVQNAKISTAMRMEINSIQLLIIRDFVRSWYADFSYDTQFLKESKQVLQEFFNNIVLHISCQNSKHLLCNVVSLYQQHLSYFQRAKCTYDSHQIHPKTKVPSDSKLKRLLSIEEAFEELCSFHSALGSEESELNYLRGVVSMLILCLVPKPITAGMCSRTFFVEIFSKQIFLVLMDMLSDPDWVVEAIILLTSDEEIVCDIVGKEKNDNQVEDVNSKSEKTEELKTEEDLKNEKSKTTPVLEVVEEEDEFRDCFEENGAQSSLSPKENENSELESKLDLAVSNYAILDNSKPVKLHSMVSCTEEVLSDIAKDLMKQSGAATSGSSWDADNEESTHSAVTPSELTHYPSDSTIVSSMANLPAENSHSTKAANENRKSHSDPGMVPSPSENLFLKEYNYREGPKTERSPVNGSDDKENSPMETEHIEGNLNVPKSDTVITENSQKNSIRDNEEQSETSSDDNPSSTFPKLTSIKNFFVDSLKPSGKQQILKKPKTLALLSDKINPSNFNILSSKLKPKESGADNGGDNQEEDVSAMSQSHPPELQVDGVPISSEKSGRESVSSFASTSSGSSQTTYLADTEQTPSPGFFPSLRPFFGLSSSQYDMSSLVGDSPLATPSPASSPQIDDSTFVAKEEAKAAGWDVLSVSMSKSVVGEDQRIFQGVSIPRTMIGQEYRSTTQYCLYIIEYEALYFTEEGKSVMRSGSVKRRHREFISLQSRLEGHPSYKRHLKNIRGPKRWPSLPFKSLDKDTVEGRRVFLEKYLKDLIEVEAICNGPDLREFLAYEGDSHIAFVKKSPDITVPRIDKMFMRGVSGVVDKLKALPNIPQEVMSGLRGRESFEDRVNRVRNQWDSDTIDLNIGVKEETGPPTLPSCVHQLVITEESSDQDKVHVSEVMADPLNREQIQEVYDQEVDKVLASFPRIQGDGAEISDEIATTSADDLALSMAVLDLFIQGLQEHDHWLRKDRVVQAMQGVLGKALNRYLESSISSVTSEPQMTRYLRLLRETLWPQGQLRSESKPSRTDDERAAIKEQAKRCLVNFFPESLRIVVGRAQFDELINIFLRSVSIQKLNKHLLYQILDMLVEELFPTITGPDLLHDLLFSKSWAIQR